MDISSMIRTPAVRFSIRSDELEEQPAKLKADYQTIMQIPSLLCIGQQKLTGIIGEQTRVQEVVRNIILQLAMLHSYTDVRLICLFREAERENAALPEEEEKQKKPAGSKAADAAPTELVLPQREARTGSPVRYILIGALLAGALCIAIYLFTHPAREDDPADETKP